MLGRAARFLLDHSPMIGAAVVILAGLVWFLAPREEPLKLLQARCEEQHLPVRMVELERGSVEEKKFILMVPASNRERLGDRQWAFCRANLTIVPRQGARP